MQVVKTFCYLTQLYNFQRLCILGRYGAMEIVLLLLHLVPHSLLLLSPKSDTHLTVPWRVEG